MSVEQNKASICRLYKQAFNHTGSLAVMDELVAADLIDHAAPPGLAPGREGFKQLIALWRTAVPDICFTIDDVIGEGDKVVIRWTGGGIHLGNLMGVPPTGKRATMTGIVVNRMADDKLVERWGNSDDLGLLQQLGVLSALAQ
jgi:predicted ester cyclase